MISELSPISAASPPDRFLETVTSISFRMKKNERDAISLPTLFFPSLTVNTRRVNLYRLLTHLFIRSTPQPPSPLETCVSLMSNGENYARKRAPGTLVAVRDCVQIPQEAIAKLESVAKTNNVCSRINIINARSSFY